MAAGRTSTAVRSKPALIAVVVLGVFAVAVAWLRLSPAATLALLPASVLLTYGVARAAVGMPPTIKGNVLDRRYDGKRYQLVAMPINHFGERLRFCLDLLGARYEESDVAGILSIFLRGRTVPWLVDRQSNSIIGNSDEALWYLGAVHVPGMSEPGRTKAQALLRRDEHSLAWEERLNVVGHAVQGWAYFHFLGPGGKRDHCLRMWGARDPHVPWPQRVILRVGYPILKAMMRKAFNLSDGSVHARRRAILDQAIEEVEAALERSGGPFLFGERLSYVDISFCALVGPLLPHAVLPRWARGRFRSLLPMLDDPAWPKELSEFEVALSARPCGRYITHVYGECRDACFAPADEAPKPRRPFVDMLPRR